MEVRGMTTATPTRTLAEILRERWQQYDKVNWHSSSGDPLDDACDQLSEALIESYRIEAGDEYLAADWIEETEAAIQSIARTAWEEQVVPAVIEAIVQRMPSYPAWIANHPDAEQLRADLAALEAGR
jgi:hypothetical protein